MTALRAKYVYRFWRPVTTIDPAAVTDDEFGPVPGQQRDGEPGDHRTSRLAAAPDHTESSRVSERARGDHVGDGPGVQHVSRHEPDRSRRSRVRSLRACRKPERCPSLSRCPATCAKRSSTPACGRAALPLLDRRRCRYRAQDRTLRSHARLPTRRLARNGSGCGQRAPQAAAAKIGFAAPKRETRPPMFGVAENVSATQWREPVLE